MDSRIRRAIKFMEQNLGAKVTAKELVDQSGLTSQYFCVLFKCETGETPTRYLNHFANGKGPRTTGITRAFAAQH